MTISLVGLTLHVADVDRSVEFYRRLPGAAVLFHLPGRFAMLRLGAGRLGLLADRKAAVPRRAGSARPRGGGRGSPGSRVRDRRPYQTAVGRGGRASHGSRRESARVRRSPRAGVTAMASEEAGNLALVREYDAALAQGPI